MRQVNLYVIYDRVAMESGPIFEAPNHGVALRGFRQGMANVDPLDKDAYKLMQVGTMDKASMKVECLFPPEEILFGIEGIDE